MLGLTRALLGSGVRGLVVSLWPVDDVFACLTMIDFQERLKVDPQLPPAEALAASAAWLGGLSPDEATTRYERPTDRTRPVERRLRTTRDIERLLPGPTRDDPAHPSAWAPFVCVGAP